MKILHVIYKNSMYVDNLTVHVDNLTVHGATIGEIFPLVTAFQSVML